MSYINKEQLEALISRYAPESYGVVNKLINQLPTIEAEPIKHGRWIEERSGKVLDLVKYHCSECGRWQTWSNFPYCPNCGAKMDKEE